MKLWYGIIFLISFGSTACSEVKKTEEKKVEMSLDDLKKGIGVLYDIVKNNKISVTSQEGQSVEVDFLEKSEDYDTKLESTSREQFAKKIAYYMPEPSTLVKSSGSFDRNYSNLQILTMSFCAFLEKKYSYQSKSIEQFKEIRTVELFDDLLSLRLQCADYLQKAEHKESKNLVVGFSLLAVSRWNPFYWGNWYDRLHRKIVTLPSMPWNENDKNDTNKALVESHIRAVEKMIEPLSGEGTTEKAILQIYVLTMRELRILVRKDLTTKGRSRLRWLGGAGLIAGLGLATRYFMGGKKASEKGLYTTQKNRKFFEDEIAPKK